MVPGGQAHLRRTSESIRYGHRPLQPTCLERDYQDWLRNEGGHLELPVFGSWKHAGRIPSKCWRPQVFLIVVQGCRPLGVFSQLWDTNIWRQMADQGNLPLHRCVPPRRPKISLVSHFWLWPWGPQPMGQMHIAFQWGAEEKRVLLQEYL